MGGSIGRLYHDTCISEVWHMKTDLKVFVVVIPCHTLSYAHPSFGMTPTFREYNLWWQQSQILKSRCHTKRRMGAATLVHPSFGMTATKTVRFVFSWCTSCIFTLTDHVECQYITVILVTSNSNCMFWYPLALLIDHNDFKIPFSLSQSKLYANKLYINNCFLVVY